MFHVLIRLAVLLAMLNNEGMGGLEIHVDSTEIDSVSLAVLGSFLKCGLTEISTLTLTLTLTLNLNLTAILKAVASSDITYGDTGLDAAHEDARPRQNSLAW